jgi:hypothetical protein
VEGIFVKGDMVRSVAPYRRHAIFVPPRSLSGPRRGQGRRGIADIGWAYWALVLCLGRANNMLWQRA